MPRVRLIHWKPEEATPRAATLRAAGYTVDFRPVTPETLRELRARPPAAVVIDLSRVPSHGRDVALAIRESKGTRHLPLVFVAGEAEKVARIRSALPDAVYATWRGIRGALRSAIAHPPERPVVPQTRLDGYSGTPLPKKLGIKPGHTVVLVGAPDDFESTLGRVPDGVALRRQNRGARNLTIWFVTSRVHLEGRMASMAERAGEGAMWIAWPKQASGVRTDVTQNLVRERGLAAGLVDYKICAIDATWSGLLFTRRKSR
jgi:CheY-like chemotaxis protein